MIYITGDCHNNFTRFDKKTLKRNNLNLTADDYVIVCGDFGLLWEEGEQMDNNIHTYFASKPFTILWVQGNHENYDLISKYPISEWNGGKVRFISDNIILLERGQVFTIEGKKFFTMGGASSHDYKYLLDPANPDFAVKKKKGNRQDYRIIGTEWWPEELPNEEELAEGVKNLEAHHFQVDYVITHCAGRKLIREWLDIDTKEDCLTKYFDELEEKLDYKFWYFGHYHQDEQVDEKHFCFFQAIYPIEKC